MILNIYPYGSHVYGSNDELSDSDLIIVTDSPNFQEECQFKWPGIDVTALTAPMFQEQLNDHEPSALECWFLRKELTYCSKEFSFNLDLEKLRRSFSGKSSNSWVKAKKKIEVHNEWRLGLKSLFHSFRILIFGIQIAEYGRITDYSAANGIWRSIDDFYKEFLETGLKPEWLYFKDRFQPKYNALRTQFRIAAPLK